MSHNYNIDSNNVKDIWSLTSTQEGLLYHHLSNPDGTQYLIQMVFEIKADLNMEHVLEAWKSVIAKNDVLRVVFRWENISQPVQIVLYEKEVPIQFVSVSVEIPSECFLDEFKKNDVKRGIDIKKDPFRLSLICMKENIYYMIITFHHILFDGWSNSIIWKEFLAQYTALWKNDCNKIAEKRQFKDYIKWIELQDKQKQKKYWSEYLKNLHMGGQIIGDHRGDVLVDCNNKLIHHYSDNQSQRIYDFIQHKQLTLATFFYTIWGMIIKIFTDSDDVVFGTTVSGRNNSITGIENMVGMFMNTIPLRVQFSEKDTIANLLCTVQDILIHRQEYENTLLLHINEYCGIKDQRLFDTIVVIENYPMNSANNFLDFKFDSIYEYTEYNLTLQIDTLENLSITLSYNTGVYSKEFVARILDLCTSLIEKTIRNDQMLLDELEMKSYVNRNRIKYEFNQTYLEYDKTLSICKLFQNQVERNKDKIAVRFGDINISYKELDEMSDVVAERILSDNIKVGSIIGLFVERNPNMLIGILGILKAGCTYLPLDQMYPEDRIRYMLKDSKTKVLLTEKSVLSVQQYEMQCIYMDELDYGKQSSEYRIDINCESTAYIIYTSGSTGKPKGVEISHRAVNNFIHAMKERIPFQSEYNIINLTTISFDIFVLETILPITIGMTVIVGTEKEQMDPVALNQVITQYQTDIIQLTPSRLRLIVNSGIDLGFMKQLKTIMIGGEPFPNELFETLTQYTKASIYNMYGPTETTVWSAVKKIEDVNAIDIGKPIANTQIYIMGKNNMLKPIGAYGEICIGGDGVFNGYYGNKDLTDKKLISDPFDKSRYIYRTGDVGRWNEDGNIQCIGRVDHQVKLRGYRIELEEIEACLLKMETINEAVVEVLEDKEKNEYLCAFFVSSIEISKETIVNVLEQKLPQYMIPDYFIRMDKLPRTDNGKINRNCLNLPEQQTNQQNDLKNELGELEMHLIDIWRSILSVEQIQLQDRFFDISGNSILLMQLYAKLNMEYPGLFTVTDLYNNNTIEKQVMFIEKSQQCEMNKSKHRNYISVDKNLWFIEINKITTAKYGSVHYEFDGRSFESIQLSAIKYRMNVKELLVSVFAASLSEYLDIGFVTFDAILNFEKIIDMRINLEQYEELEEFLSEFTAVYRGFTVMERNVLDEDLQNERGLSIVWYDMNQVKQIDSLKQIYDISIGIRMDDQICSMECIFNCTKLKEEKVMELIKYYITYLKHLN